VNVEDAEKNAEAEAIAFGSGDAGDFSDFAVGGRDDEAALRWDGAGGIAEEPEEEGSEQQRRDGPDPVAG
jgi:hypothetical protein